MLNLNSLIKIYLILFLKQGSEWKYAAYVTNSLYFCLLLSYTYVEVIYFTIMSIGLLDISNR